MMKKIIFVFVFCILLCGCGAKYQVSELEPTTLSKLEFVKGSIKKIEDHSCDNYIQINFEYRNGTITGDAYIILENIEKDKIVNFEEIAYGVSDIETDWSNYKLKFKNVECWLE